MHTCTCTLPWLQLDQHYGELTVRQTLEFSARVQGGRRGAGAWAATAGCLASRQRARLPAGHPAPGLLPASPRVACCLLSTPPRTDWPLCLPGSPSHHVVPPQTCWSFWRSARRSWASSPTQTSTGERPGLTTQCCALVARLPAHPPALAAWRRLTPLLRRPPSCGTGCVQLHGCPERLWQEEPRSGHHAGAALALQSRARAGAASGAAHARKPCGLPAPRCTAQRRAGAGAGPAATRALKPACLSRPCPHRSARWAWMSARTPWWETTCCVASPAGARCASAGPGAGWGPGAVSRHRAGLGPAPGLS